MDLNEIITICILNTILRLVLVLSFPTFGTENVHIKVYIPDKEDSCTKRIIKTEQPVTYHAAPSYHVDHKIIHHYYHHLPRVIKQVVPELEHFFLAELDEINSPDYMAEYSAEPIVEQEHLYDSKPKVNFNSFKAEEENEQQYKLPAHIDYGKNHEELIASAELLHHDNEGHDHHIEYAELLENNAQYNYQQEKHVPKKKIINKIIEAPKFMTSPQDNNNYGHEMQVKEMAKEKQQKHAANHQYESRYQTQYDYQQPKKQEILKFPAAPANHQILSTATEPPKRSVVDRYKSIYNISNPKYAMKYQIYLPCSKNQTKNSVCDDANTKDDPTNAVVNPRAGDTYMGYDSYSADHVQGLGSGGYRFLRP